MAHKNLELERWNVQYRAREYARHFAKCRVVKESVDVGTNHSTLVIHILLSVIEVQQGMIYALVIHILLSVIEAQQGMIGKNPKRFVFVKFLEQDEGFGY